MNFLRNYLDKQKPKFEKGGKLEKFHSVFTGFESFLFRAEYDHFQRSSYPGCRRSEENHDHRGTCFDSGTSFRDIHVGYLHFNAVGGLADTTFFQLFFYGLWKVLPMIIVSYVVGLGIEFAVAQMKGHEINEGFLVSGLLIPMIMPVEAPLWMVALSTAFAVIIGKEFSEVQV